MTCKNAGDCLPDSASIARRRRHREMLLVASAVVILSFGLDVRSDQRVVPRQFPSCPVPQTCLSQMLFGVKCPACGLTRSFIHLAHWDWSASLAMHRLGWLMALAVLIQFPYRLYLLGTGKWSKTMLVVGSCFGYFLILSLIVNWLYDILSTGKTP